MASRCLRVSGDCTDAAVVSAFFDGVESAFGPVDILFNNVGQSARERGAPFVESREEVWRFVLEAVSYTHLRAHET